jgi:threonine dehydrogenase-like Zn-dependent dehydrogenase
VKCVVVEPGARRAALRECDPPQIAKPQDVRLRGVEVGICGTDQEILSFTHGSPPPGRDRWILGHEALLRVVEPAPETDGRPRLGEGDLVVPMVRRPCHRPDCRPCRRGRQDFCRTGEFRERGITRADGFMAQETVEEERYLVPVPARLRAVAVLTEPLSIAEKALDQTAALQHRMPWGCVDPAQGCHALVLGAGAVGLLGALKLRAQGFTVTVYSRGPADGRRAQWVHDLGGGYVSAEDADSEALLRLVGEADLIYEATGAAELAFEVLERLLATNGVFVFTGIPGRRAVVELPVSQLMRDLVLRNQLVVGTVNAARRHYEDAIRDLSLFETRFPKLLERLVTRRVPLERWQEAMRWSREDVKRVVTLGDAV